MASESALQPFTEQYRALANAQALPGHALPWLHNLREDAIRAFNDLGFPTPKVEEWKYTNLRSLERTIFHPATEHTAGVSIDTVPSLIGDKAGHRAVFVNGRLRPELSRLGRLPEGAEVMGFAQMLDSDPAFLEEHIDQIADRQERQALYHLNTALMRDGLVLRVRQGSRIAEPIEAVFLSLADEEPLAFHPRNLLVLEDDSEATLVEHHVSLGAGTSFANAATEVRVGRNARLHHYKLQDESAGAFHVHTLHGRIAGNALYDGFGLSVGGKLARNELHLRLEGEFADARLNGAYLMRGKQHCDNTTLIEHCVPDTSCREVFKGAVTERGRAVFQGKLHVHPDAQRTDGYQLSRALLLSDEAEVDSKPELEIYADDVQCSHGSTAGSLDELALFYLRSRGIPYPAARRLLVESFLAEAIAEMTNEDLQGAFMQRMSDWLEKVND